MSDAVKLPAASDAVPSVRVRACTVPLLLTVPATTEPVVLKLPPPTLRTPSVSVALEVSNIPLKVPETSVAEPSVSVDPFTNPLLTREATVSEGFAGSGRLATPVKLPFAIVMVPSVKVVNCTIPLPEMFAAVTEPLVEK